MNVEKHKKLIRKKLADEIRSCRIKKGLTQKEMSQRLGASQPLISRMEKGVFMPKKKTLLRVCAALGLESDHFDSVVEEGEVVEKKSLEIRLSSLESKVDLIMQDNLPFEREGEIIGGNYPAPGTKSAVEVLSRGDVAGGGRILKVDQSLVEPCILPGDSVIVRSGSREEYENRLCLVNIKGRGMVCGIAFFREGYVAVGGKGDNGVILQAGDSIKGVIIGRISPYEVIADIEDIILNSEFR